MKKVVLTGIKKMKIQEFDHPPLVHADDVLLKMNVVGVCGSDMHYYKEGRIGDQIVKYPFVVGHEGAATVVEVGKNVQGMATGDLVFVEPSVPCENCTQCLADRKHTCLNVNFLGVPGQMEGCLAEYLVLPGRNCIPIPSGITPEQVTLVEPLSIGYYATQFIKKPVKEVTVAILGAGPIGLSVLLSAKAIGIDQIYVTDKLDYRLVTAGSAGAVWTGNPDREDVTQKLNLVLPQLFDVVIECCGKQEALDQAVEILKPGGLLLVVGIPAHDRISFDMNLMRRKEISIQNVRRQNNTVQSVIDLLAAGNINPEFMITHRFPLEKTQEAFDLVADYRDNVIKAAIEFA